MTYHDPGVCSDIHLTASDIVSAYAGQWSIEDTFRATKQTMLVQQPQSWASKAPQRAAMLVFPLYSLSWWWFLTLPKSAQAVSATPWWATKATRSFADALAALRQDLWRKRIIDYSGHGPVSPG